MTLHNFSKENSILNQFIAELRDVNIQKDAMRFRKNIERIGEVLGYELSKTLNYKDKKVETPFGHKKVSMPQNKIVLCSVLRAGLPLHQGLLNYFDKAENAFISAYRHHRDNQDAFKVIVKYLAAPSLTNKILVLSDPMLATGKTLENVYSALKKHGIPKQIHIVSVIGSKSGVEYVKEIFPEYTHLWIATIDDILSSKGYIIPGLGDAGDLSFGLKL
ncbi:uracil phosphoribosyltransferase [Flavobacteriaceae bacterium S0825]|uniref:uracil phosphoribosyltransferase n=1 Tax=Gaetbulibacter sp. S0825 TaxID=2720084 RepID=UPI001430D5B2|nr:uracil phosphoribosyltransferase [Gaetbulibacter sp. S0825]MCK0109442.1 uracil phosphoribosyltransferase [Flavobacteriaceae bacterium S0825]NIX65077.1 uracil phosphoribosyltransferase [Gaetbulibacter sp. S0825]